MRLVPAAENTVPISQVEHLFRCRVCFEAQPQRYYSCPRCGRFIGCYDCVVPRLHICPTCRQGLPSNPHPAPSLIPGAADLLGLSTVTDTPAQPDEDVDNGNDDDEDNGELYDTLPVVSFQLAQLKGMQPFRG